MVAAKTLPDVGFDISAAGDSRRRYSGGELLGLVLLQNGRPPHQMACIVSERRAVAYPRPKVANGCKIVLDSQMCVGRPLLALKQGEYLFQSTLRNSGESQLGRLYSRTGRVQLTLIYGNPILWTEILGHCP